MWAKDGKRVVASGGNDECQGKREENDDLEGAERHTCPCRKADAAVGEPPHDQARGYREGRPEPGGPAKVRREVCRELVTKDQVEQGCDEGLGQHEAPGDQEPDVGMKPTGAERVEAARRRKVAGQLPDADRDQQAGDQRQEHGERDSNCREQIGNIEE